MCSPIPCRTCGKTTWSGCGQHVDQVMRHVPASQRCEGHTQGFADVGSDQYGNGFLGQLFGR